MNVAKEIKRIMFEDEIENKELAKRLGVTVQAFGAKLARNNMITSEIEKIADALGYEVEIKFKKK